MGSHMLFTFVGVYQYWKANYFGLEYKNSSIYMQNHNTAPLAASRDSDQPTRILHGQPYRVGGPKYPALFARWLAY